MKKVNLDVPIDILPAKISKIIVVDKVRIQLSIDETREIIKIVPVGLSNIELFEFKGETDTEVEFHKALEEFENTAIAILGACIEARNLMDNMRRDTINLLEDEPLLELQKDKDGDLKDNA